jgi:hypothetical protein
VRAAVFPDSEAIAVRWINTSTLGVPTGTDLVGWRAGQARVVITRIGGVPSIPFRVDNPRLDVAVLAASKEAAHDLAQRVRAHLHELPTGDFTDAGAVVAHVRDDMGLSYLPDPETGSPRYLFGVSLAVRPHP